MHTKIACLMVLWTLSVVPAHALFDPPPVQVADDVAFERYAGLWYEVARSPNLFQLGCVCTTAHYTLSGEASIGILNVCNNVWPGGSQRRAEGVGVVADPEDSNAKLRIGFFGGEPTADYWILDVVDDPQDPTGPYRFAVVGAPDRSFLFILSRDPRPRSFEDRAALEGILERLQDQQYPTFALLPSRQPGSCRYEDRMP